MQILKHSLERRIEEGRFVRIVPDYFWKSPMYNLRKVSLRAKCSQCHKISRLYATYSEGGFSESWLMEIVPGFRLSCCSFFSSFFLFFSSFLRFFSSLSIFVIFSASAKLSTAIAKNTFNRMSVFYVVYSFIQWVKESINGFVRFI